MMNLLVVLVVTQIAVIFFRRTLIGKITVMIFRTIHKLAKAILIMDYKFVCRIYRFIANHDNKYRLSSKQQTKQPIKKAVGSEEINYDDYENVVDLKQYKKKVCKGQ